MTLEEEIEELKRKTDEILEMLTPENIIQYTEEEVAELQEALKKLRETIESIVE